jgi:hypothetical protein
MSETSPSIVRTVLLEPSSQAGSNAMAAGWCR